MTSLLGIRYPKQFEMSTMAPTNTPSVTDFHLTGQNLQPYMVGDLPTIIPIAPFRYSEVRKVVFHASVRFATTTNTKVRLRVAAMSTSGVNITPDPFTLAAGSSVRLEGTGQVWHHAGFATAHLFSKVGSTSTANLPISTNQIAGPTFTLTLEFDRFQAGSADFFQYWDSQSDPDKYLGFRIVVEGTDVLDFTAVSGTCADLGVTVVQAPSSNNKSCTIVPMSPGHITDSQMQNAFTLGYRAGLFRYIASNWDNITSINMLTWNFWASSNTRTFDIDLYNLTSYAPTTQNLLHTDAVTDNTSRAGGDVTLFRSADIKGFLVDGADHGVLYKNNGGAAVTNPITWLEIIQQGFEKTECHHSGGNQFRIETTPTLYGSPATPPFDPTWYQSFPSDRIASRKLHIALSHVSTTIDTTIRLHMDSNLQADITGLSGTSPTLVGILPQQGSSPTATQGTKNQYANFGPDPMGLVGVRKLVFGIVIGTGAGTDDFIGTCHIVYALLVPARETPEIGPIFNLDAFNPEGCASTAAGLGDPGVLVLTNGSTIPQKFDPQQNNIEDCGIPTPFCDEAAPSTQVDDTAASPDGGLSIGVYKYRYTFRNCCTGKESDPSDADIVVDTTGASPAAQVTLNFTAVRIPGDPQICEICIYRTVVGGDFPVMAKVGCFDPDTTSTFIDDLPDADLDFSNKEISQLNAPMPCVPVVVEYRNRLFGMGDIPELSPAGTVSAENGSDIITGDLSVEWTRCLEGKYIQLEGDCHGYEIQCVMPPASPEVFPPLARLKLTTPYDGDSKTGALYTICGRPNRLYFSEPFEAEYWPQINFIDVEVGDGDRLIGAVSNYDSLLICKRRKSYVLRFNENPLTEVVCPDRISSDIGCIAPRSFAQVESGSVWLADRGLALFDGRSVQMLPESVMFDSYFTDPDNPNYVRRDSTGRCIGAVGVYYPKRQQYLLLLPTVQTDRGANLLMVWDTQLRNITVHKFCNEFLSLTVGKDSDGNTRVYAGDANGFVWILDIGDNDGAGYPGSVGTVKGTVTDSGIDPIFGVGFIEDSNASFITGGLPGLAGLSGVAGLSAAFDGTDLGLAGICVFYRSKAAKPDDPWESRVIFAATEKRLYITPTFVNDAPTPDLFEYKIGPMEFRAEFKPTDYGDDDTLKRNWRQVLVYEVEDLSSIVRVQLIPDLQNSDPLEDTIEDDEGNTGQGHEFDLSFAGGRQTRPVGRILYNFMQVVISHFDTESPVRILNHLMGVAPHTSK